MKLIRQLLTILAVCMAGELLAGALPFPFPASVAGLLILLGLMAAKIIKPGDIKETAEYLLGNMAVFFIPAGVSIMEQLGQLKDSALPLLLICIISLLLTFGAAAGTTALAIRWVERGKRHD